MAKIKSNSVTQFTLEHDGNITFKVIGAGTRLFDRSKTSLEVRHQAELQGWVKRIINMAALTRDTDTGLSATPKEKFDRMVRAIEWYESGTTDWRIGGTQGRADDTGLTFLAIMRVFKLDVKACEAKIVANAAKREIERDAYIKLLGKTEAVVRAVGEIKAERAAANKAVNAEDLLAEMGDDEGDE